MGVTNRFGASIVRILGQRMTQRLSQRKVLSPIALSYHDEAKVKMQNIHRRFIDHLYAKDVGCFVELPQIAVMGDTSSGKSSLLTAISSIPFPSNDQITTRCPVRVRMERKNDTKIKVDIKWHATSSYRDEKWQMLLFHDFNEIQEAIEKAQECILKAASRAVAPDIVEISVHSPDAVDLTLIDLPGLVRSVGKGEKESMVSDIASLIAEFLKNERCIILAVVPANVDFHNSQIMADAIKVDPKTKRTIPVITKPDLIDAGAENAVKELLLGNKKDFRLGFHMIKCRGQKALNDGISLTDGINQERQFFTTTSPWKEIEDRELFGVESLCEKLAALQVRMIEESVPSIMREVAHKKELALRQIKELGKDLSTDALRREYFTRWFEDVLPYFTGAGMGSFRTYHHDVGYTWQSKLQILYSDFSTNILKQSLANMGDFKIGQAVYVVDKDEGEAEGVVYQIGNEKNSNVVYVDPVDSTQQVSTFFEQEVEKIWEGDHKVGEKHSHPDMRNPYIIRSVIAVSSSSSPKKQEKVKLQEYKPFPLSSVYVLHRRLEDLLSRSRTEGLSCFLNQTVFNSVVADMMRSDVEPRCFGLLNDCKALLSALTVAVMHRLGSHSHQLSTLLQERARAVIADLYGCAQRRLRERLDAEKQPFTSNHYLHEMISKKRNEHLKRRLLNATARMYDPKSAAAAITTLFDQNERRSCEEHLAIEMQVILESYGKLASKRIIDDVPMLITAAMITPLADRLRGVMSLTDVELRVLLEDAPDKTRQRRQAVEQLRAMEAAEEAIKTLSHRQFE